MKKILFLLFMVAGCGNGTKSGMDMAAGPDLMQPVGVMLEAACTDSLASVYGDPGALSADKGAIIRCAKDKDLTVADLQTQLNTDGFTARALTSGAHLYRILYRTERGTTTPQPGYATALVLLPDTPRAAKMPVVVANHGTRGIGPACAASKIDPSDDSVNNDYRRQVYSLVGYGYAVVAPDSSGYANYGAANNPPSGYLVAGDEGRAALDGARALRRLIPSSLTAQVALVGHSQGGHTALAALSLSDSYGADGTIAAVVTISPVWIATRSWGALLALAASYPFSSQPGVNSFSIWYHYTAGELFDGPGHGLDVFAAGKRALVKDFMDNSCEDYPNWTRLNAMGSNAMDVFDPTFNSAIASYAAGLDTACPTGANNALCVKWMARYAADRPHITGTAAKVPIALVWGGMDTTIAYDRISCGIDRLKSDGISFDGVCVDPTANHNDITGARADFVADYIASKTLGAPAPAACPKGLEGIVDPMGKPGMCAALPPNVDM